MRDSWVLWLLTAVLLAVDVALLLRAGPAPSGPPRSEPPIFVAKIDAYGANGERIALDRQTADVAVLVPLSRGHASAELRRWHEVSEKVSGRAVFVAYCLSEDCPAPTSGVRVATSAPVLLSRALRTTAQRGSVLAMDWKHSTVGELRWASLEQVVGYLKRLL